MNERRPLSPAMRERLDRILEKNRKGLEYFVRCDAGERKEDILTPAQLQALDDFNNRNREA